MAKLVPPPKWLTSEGAQQCFQFVATIAISVCTALLIYIGAVLWNGAQSSARNRELIGSNTKVIEANAVAVRKLNETDGRITAELREINARLKNLEQGQGELRKLFQDRFLK